jgi:hypothetical protein
MAGYIIHHKSALYDGVRADLYQNDPYVWFEPYLWSFCHLNQNPRVEKGMTVLWVTKADGTFVCDLVFVVEEILPFREALNIYPGRDAGLARLHFQNGMAAHPEVMRRRAKTYVADMGRSYIPHPAVPIEVEVDRVRLKEKPGAKPLAVVCSRRSPPLRVAAIDELEKFVFINARQHHRRALGALELPRAKCVTSKAHC